MIVCKSPDELVRMRDANQLVADVLTRLQAMVCPGVTTRELDSVAESQIREAGAIPAFKGYQGYPATLCASINDAVVHGIPSDRPLEDGDVVSLDMGVVLDGYYGDSAVTLGVGSISSDATTLLTVTREALDRAIECVRVDGRVSDIGHAVQQHVEAHGFSVVREFVGHGIGSNFTRSRRSRTMGNQVTGPGCAKAWCLRLNRWSMQVTRESRCSTTAGRRSRATAGSQRISSTRWRSRLRDHRC